MPVAVRVPSRTAGVCHRARCSQETAAQLLVEFKDIRRRLDHMDETGSIDLMEHRTLLELMQKVLRNTVPDTTSSK